jgi:ABC-type lipoprotein export system ATPase subunit
MISFQDVSKVYVVKKNEAVTAVQNVSLSVNPSEFVVITGRSGSGKTTILNLVAGLTRPSSGQVFMDNVEVWRLPDRQQAQFRNQRIGFVFQFPSLIPSLTVLENVLLPTIYREKQERSAVHKQALTLLDEIGLSEKLNAFPRQLSAGQQQRVVIARALINHPEVILADEPTSNLDEQTEKEIMGLFKELNAGRKITIMMVTHSNELVNYGTRAIRMAGGAIVEA